VPAGWGAFPGCPGCLLVAVPVGAVRYGYSVLPPGTVINYLPPLARGCGKPGRVGWEWATAVPDVADLPVGQETVGPGTADEPLSGFVRRCFWRGAGGKGEAGRRRVRFCENRLRFVAGKLSRIFMNAFGCVAAPRRQRGQKDRSGYGVLVNAPRPSGHPPSTGDLGRCAVCLW